MVYSGLAGVKVMDVLAGKASLADTDPTGGKGLQLARDFAAGKVPSLLSLGNLGSPSKTDARAAVEWAAAVGRRHGLQVISGSRPGAVTTTGNVSNHSANNAGRAARDLSNTNNRGGSPEQEAALRDIMEGFGQHYRSRGPIIITFKWGKLRMEIIYRTPKYGDHRGHIHVGGHQ